MYVDTVCNLVCGHSGGSRVFGNTWLPAAPKDVTTEPCLGEVNCCGCLYMRPVNRRVRDKYEAELKEVERSEKSTLEKYNAMKVGGRPAAIRAITNSGLSTTLHAANPFTAYWHT